MSLLLINTCSRTAEIAFDGKVFRSELGGGEALSVLLEEIQDLKSIKKICFISGPGSYTGLRVGAAFSLGLSTGFNVPVNSVSTFLINTLCFDVFQGNLGIVVPASPTDVYYCEFKCQSSEFWIPSMEYRIVELAELEIFLNQRKESLENYRFEKVEEFFTIPANPKNLLNKLEVIFNNEQTNWIGNLKLNSIQELIYIKPVAAKSIIERKNT